MNFVVRKVGEVREVLNFVVGVVWEGKKVREVVWVVRLILSLKS